MFKVRSPSVVCPACGSPNRAQAIFCAACAARLGEEPSIAHAQQRAAAAAATVPPPHGIGLDAPRTNYSRPMPLHAPPSDALGFWFKFCMTGLVLMLGFIAWAVYVLTGSKAVPPLPVGQGGAAPMSQSAPPAPPAASTPPLVAAVAPASASQKSVAAASAPPATPAPPPARVATTRRAPDADTDANPDTRRRSPETAQQRPAGAQRQASRERSRQPVWNEEEEVAAPGGGAWVMPSRPPAVTSSPQFRDAGPPIVPGPGPREPYVAAQDAPAAVPAGDLGPPIAVGPGPRYDYSTPSAGAGRR
ncbi:zinc ribbon domain-containing protein [Variovorax fucosicus]|uniref:zinc ribbon domain-containing protein n=1 Tax=Variovorax fucosicus TaxID=3053517 RepID=UPI0025752EF2|nr:zinc ribbon domain-containing protein [Variovorax sp. J22G47]MDM0055301.1 zinc ribbon domain-containing protein [Variovorax sp. J22G47]